MSQPLKQIPTALKDSNALTAIVFMEWLKEPDRSIKHLPGYDSWHATSHNLGNHTTLTVEELATKLLKVMGYEQP